MTHNFYSARKKPGTYFSFVYLNKVILFVNGNSDHKISSDFHVLSLAFNSHNRSEMVRTLWDSRRESDDMIILHSILMIPFSPSGQNSDSVFQIFRSEVILQRPCSSFVLSSKPQRSNHSHCAFTESTSRAKIRLDLWIPNKMCPPLPMNSSGRVVSSTQVNKWTANIPRPFLQCWSNLEKAASENWTRINVINTPDFSQNNTEILERWIRQGITTSDLIYESLPFSPNVGD